MCRLSRDDDDGVGAVSDCLGLSGPQRRWYGVTALVVMMMTDLKIVEVVVVMMMLEMVVMMILMMLVE